MTTPGITRTFRQVRLNQPAAGTQWELRPGGQRWWRVISLLARLTTSAVVGNRRVSLRLSDGGHTYWAMESHANHIASTTADYMAHTGATANAADSLVLTLPLPSAGLLIRPGAVLVSAVSGMDVADAWSAIVALVEEVPEAGPRWGDDLYLPPETVGR